MPKYKDQTTIIEREFYDRVAMISGYTKNAVRDIFLAAYELVEDELKNGTPVVVGKFGTFSRKEISKNGGFDFHKNEVIKERGVSAKIKFTPYKPFKKAIKDSPLLGI